MYLRSTNISKLPFWLKNKTGKIVSISCCTLQKSKKLKNLSQTSIDSDGQLFSSSFVTMLHIKNVKVPVDIFQVLNKFISLPSHERVCELSKRREIPATQSQGSMRNVCFLHRELVDRLVCIVSLPKTGRCSKFYFEIEFRQLTFSCYDSY